MIFLTSSSESSNTSAIEPNNQQIYHNKAKRELSSQRLHNIHLNKGSDIGILLKHPFLSNTKSSGFNHQFEYHAIHSNQR